jgi:hypothetical protein
VEQAGRYPVTGMIVIIQLRLLEVEEAVIMVQRVRVELQVEEEVGVVDIQVRPM